MGEREHALVHEIIERAKARKSPEAAAARFRQHILNWGADLAGRRDFYTGVIEATLPTLKPEDAATLRRIWYGMLQRAEAQTDEERAEIDAWLDPLVASPAPAGTYDWMACLMDCEGGYFTAAVDAELDQLVQVPGFDAAEKKLEWPNER